MGYPALCPGEPETNKKSKQNDVWEAVITLLINCTAKENIIEKQFLISINRT